MMVNVKTATHTADRCSHVIIDGNPAKFFQGHNLWGSDDLPSLAVALATSVANRLGIEVHPDDLSSWLTGDIQLTRVDCTLAFHLDSPAQVLAWIRSAEQTAYMAHRGRGTLLGTSTLVFGFKSRRWSLKIYAKGPEVRKLIKKQPAIANLPHALAWADRCLRAELQLRSLELKRERLSFVRNWMACDELRSETVTAKLLSEKLGAMTMTTTASISAEVLEGLRPPLRVAVAAWEAGHDLRQSLTRPTFYRYRAELLPHGIDIATVMPKDVSNVVPLYRVLEAKPVTAPDWAMGTMLYFEPRLVA
jgi:II/X family phage/plasmid replication protein